MAHLNVRLCAQSNSSHSLIPTPGIPADRKRLKLANRLRWDYELGREAEEVPEQDPRALLVQLSLAREGEPRGQAREAEGGAQGPCQFTNATLPYWYSSFIWPCILMSSKNGETLVERSGLGLVLIRG